MDSALKRTSAILRQNIRSRRPNEALKQINDLNKLLQFSDDSLLSTENLFDLKRTINCLNLEIKKLGVQLNPQKCNLIVNNVNEDDEETETIEIFISETEGKQVTYDDNVSHRVKASR